MIKMNRNKHSNRSRNNRNIRTFTAKTMPQALSLVRQAMGPDALILRTRTVRNSRLLGLLGQSHIEVVACRAVNSAHSRTGRPAPRTPNSVRPTNQPADNHPGTPNTLANDPEALRDLLARYRQTMPDQQPSISQPNPTAPSASPSQADSNQLYQQVEAIQQTLNQLITEQRRQRTPDIPDPLQELYLQLMQKEVGEELARELIHRLQSCLDTDQLLSARLVYKQITQAFQSMVRTTGPVGRNLDGSPRVVSLIGPTGVGKTTTIAKLAADLKLHHHCNVGLITLDTYRIGAVEQLRMYAQIIDVPCRVVLSPIELREAIRSMAALDVILIDTAGRAQNDTMKMTELKTFLNAAAPDEVHLVLPGTAGEKHLMDVIDHFKPLGVNRLLFTKLDEAVTFGVLLRVMQQVETAVSYFTTGQSVPDDIEVGSGTRLARLLLELEDVDGKPTPQANPEYVA